MGIAVKRKLVSTDACMTGDGHSAQVLWGRDLSTAHINYLELMAVSLALRHFHDIIAGCHVLVRTDNTATVYYVNNKGVCARRCWTG